MVADGGVYDYHAFNFRQIPPFLADWVRTGRDELAEPVAAMMSGHSTFVSWALRNGMWTFGADSVSDYMRRTRGYSLRGVAERISAPTLVFDHENDFFDGEAARVYEALVCPATLVSLSEADGAGEHCGYGARSTVHRHMFDWLDGAGRDVRRPRGRRTGPDGRRHRGQARMTGRARPPGAAPPPPLPRPPSSPTPARAAVTGTGGRIVTRAPAGSAGAPPEGARAASTPGGSPPTPPRSGRRRSRWYAGCGGGRRPWRGRESAGASRR